MRWKRRNANNNMWDPEFFGGPYDGYPTYWREPDRPIEVKRLTSYPYPSRLWVDGTVYVLEDGRYRVLPGGRTRC